MRSGQSSTVYVPWLAWADPQWGGAGGAGVWTPPPIQNCPQEVDGPFLKPPPPGKLIGGVAVLCMGNSLMISTFTAVRFSVLATALPPLQELQICCTVSLLQYTWLACPITGCGVTNSELVEILPCINWLSVGWYYRFAMYLAKCGVITCHVTGWVCGDNLPCNWPSVGW